MKKYFLIIVTLCAFLSLLSACTDDIVMPYPEEPNTPEYPLPDTLDTQHPLPDSLGTEEPTDPTDPTNPTDPTDPTNPTDPTDPTGPTDPIPGNGTVPGFAIGNWIQGTFSLTEFWNYDGSHAGNASEQSNVFVFKANGECEQYFIMKQLLYNCRTEAYSYRKGTVVFDEANGSFTFTPASGNYRGFYSCAPNSNVNRDIRPDELTPKTYYYHMEEKDGHTYMMVKHEKTDATASYFKKTIW